MFWIDALLPFPGLVCKLTESVVESTLGNFLGPFICPLLIKMYLSSNAWYTTVVPDRATGNFGELYRRVFKQLGLSIYLPLVRRIVDSNHRHANHGLASWANLAKDCPKRHFTDLQTVQDL